MLGASWGSQVTDLEIDRNLSDDFDRDFANNLNDPFLSFNDGDFLDLDPFNHFFNWNLPHNLNNLLDHAQVVKDVMALFQLEPQAQSQRPAHLLDHALHHHVLDHFYHLFNDPFDDDFAPAIIYTNRVLSEPAIIYTNGVISC